MTTPNPFHGTWNRAPALETASLRILISTGLTTEIPFTDVISKSDLFVAKTIGSTDTTGTGDTVKFTAVDVVTQHDVDFLQ